MPALETTQHYRVPVDDLPAVLQDCANNNQRRGYIEISFEEGGYEGGNDAPILASLIMAQSEE